MELSNLTVEKNQICVALAPGARAGRNRFFELIKSTRTGLSSFHELVCRSPDQHCTIGIHTVVCLAGMELLQFRLAATVRGSVARIHLDRFGFLCSVINAHGLMGLVAERGISQFGAE